MKNYKSFRKGTQVRKSNRVVRKRGHNTVARLSRVLLAEIETVLVEGPGSERLHAPGPGWQTWHKTLRRYRPAPDMNEEMEALLKGGVIVLRINQKRLAEKICLSENTIFKNMRLLVEAGVIRPLGRGLYWVGRSNKRTFIPIEIVLPELRDLKSVERADKETGTHTHRLVFQELLRLKITLRLLEKADRDRAVYWQKVQKRLKILKALSKHVPVGKTSAPRNCKNLILELSENKEFEAILLGYSISQYVFFTNVLKRFKRTYILGYSLPQENGPKPRVPGKLPRQFCAKLEKLAKRQLGPIRDPNERALTLPFIAERLVLNGGDGLRVTYQVAGDETFLPKLKRAVRYVDEISRSTQVTRSDLWKCVFARYLFLHSGKRWQMNWIGGHDFMNELVNVATVIQNVRDFKRGYRSERFLRWKLLCEEILGSHKLKGKFLEEFNEGLLFKGFESWAKLKWRFEYKYGYCFPMKYYLLSQAAYFRKYGKIEITGRVFLERTAGDEAETRAWEYCRKVCSMIPSPVEQVMPERKQELEEWWEAVQTGKTPEEPNLEEKVAYDELRKRDAEEHRKAEVVRLDAFRERNRRKREMLG